MLMVIKVISRAETENFSNHYLLFIAAHICAFGLWVIPFQVVEHIYYLSLAAEEQPACGKLMHPVGEPGSIDVSASLASTLAGFLFGALPSSWIFIFSDFWTFDAAPSTPCSMHLPIVSTLICIITSSYLYMANC